MNLVLCLGTLFLLCSALRCKLGLNISVTPLVAISGIQLLLLLFGLIGLLPVGVFVVWAAALLCGFWVFWLDRANWKQNLSAVLQPAFVFFVAITVYFWFLLSSKNAGFRVWDEFSFWGSAAKAVFQNNALYTTFENSMANTSYPPGLALVSYFLQFPASRFSEWQCYVAYDLLAMACIAPLFSRIRWKNPISVLLASVLGYFGIYEFYYTLYGLVPYANAYSDWIVGILFGGAMAVWFCSGQTGWRRTVAAMLPAMMLPLTRDIGLALGLVATGIMTMDLLLSGESGLCAEKKEGFFRRAAAGGALMLSVAVSYLVWSFHFSAMNHIPRVSIPYEYSVLEMLAGRDAYFNEILRRMWEALFRQQLVSFGTVADTIAVFTAAALLFALLSKNWRSRARIASFALLNILGFALYYLFHAYLYAAVFYHTDNYDLVSYSRYIGSYVIGWYYALLMLGCSELAAAGFEQKIPEKLRGVWSRLPGMLLVAAALFSVWHFMPVDPRFVYVHSEKVILESDGMKALAEQHARQFARVFQEKPRVYVLSQQSSGGEWFICNYAFMPAYTVKTLGGGHFVSQEIMDTAPIEELRYAVVADSEDFTNYLLEQEVDLVFLLGMDQYFIDEFSHLFADGLAERFDGSVYLYAVQRTEEGVLCHGLYSADHYFSLKEQWGE